MTTLLPVHSTSGPKRLTVIIPLRVDETNSFRLSRLGFSLMDPTARHHVDVMVADDGSPDYFARQIADHCAEYGYHYERLETSHLSVSMSRARNRGAQAASTPFIFFMDCDLIPPVGFFRKLLDEIQVLRLDACAEDMIMVPVSYLTDAATEDYLTNGGQDRHGEFLEHTINRNTSVIEKFSSGTSACVYNRLYYLARGGYVEDFTGWGYEDLEFNLRIARLTRKFPLPIDYILDDKSFDAQYIYRGWKALYRLFGDRSMLKGLMLFHAWHPVDQASAYQGTREENRRRFGQLIVDFAKNGTEPEPLPDPSHGRSLVLKKCPFTFDRILRPMLGETISPDVSTLPSDAHLRDWLISRKIDRIVFQNPYGSDEVRRIYDWARKESFPFLVCERGALPDTILFDPTGFLADSSMFDARHWDHDLSYAEECALDAYIQQETLQGSVTLEKQSGPRLKPSEIRERFGLLSSDEVVLVCLQRPGDTATRFFPGPLGTYADFVWAVEQLSRELPPNVRLLFKVHPLEDHVPDIQGINVSALHINDLLAVANKLLVYTSGTGLLAMIWNRPIVIGGNAFYENEKLTSKAETIEQLRELVCKPLTPNRIAFRRFLHYLRFRYYSVGTFKTRDVRMPDGSKMTATTEIQFSAVRNFGHADLLFASRSTADDSWQSMLFDRFMGAKGYVPPRKVDQAPKQVAAAASRTSPAPAAPARPPHEEWGSGKKALHWVSRQTIGPFQGPVDRKKLASNPTDFFQKAKWGPNRFFGRLLLDKSDRSY